MLELLVPGLAAAKRDDWPADLMNVCVCVYV